MTKHDTPDREPCIELPEAEAFIAAAVNAGKDLLVVGTPSAGKTTLVRAVLDGGGVA